MNRNQVLAEFRKLHQEDGPLMLGNVWDAHTSKLAQEAGFKALGSSSHAIAFTLGYPDGESISVDELLFVVKRIMAVAKVPVSVDFEAGYSDDPQEVAKNVQKLVDLGVVGINLEDGKVIDGKRTLEEKNILVEKIKAIKKQCDIFINARADTYTTKQKNALQASIDRAVAYHQAGADGIFVPLIETREDLKTFIEKVDLPLNVFATPDLPSYEDLKNLGVKRISHGAKQYDALMKKSKSVFEKLINEHDFNAVLKEY